MEHGASLAVHHPAHRRGYDRYPGIRRMVRALRRHRRGVFVSEHLRQRADDRLDRRMDHPRPLRRTHRSIDTASHAAKKSSTAELQNPLNVPTTRESVGAGLGRGNN